MARAVKEAAAPRQRVRERPALAVAEGSHGQWLKGCTARWLPSSVTRAFPLLCSASPAAPRASGSPLAAAGGLQGGPAVPVPRQQAGARVECRPRSLSDRPRSIRPFQSSSRETHARTRDYTSTALPQRLRREKERGPESTVNTSPWPYRRK